MISSPRYPQKPRDPKYLEDHHQDGYVVRIGSPPFIKAMKKRPFRKGSHVAPVRSLGPRRNCWAFSLFCGFVCFFVGTCFSWSVFFFGGGALKKKIHVWQVYLGRFTNNSQLNVGKLGKYIILGSYVVVKTAASGWAFWNRFVACVSCLL